MFLADLNTFDPRLNKKKVFLVSLGALEQHGRFAPLGADNFIQEALIERVEATVPDVIFLPIIPVGPSWQQLGFKGTISLREGTLYSLLEDMVDSLKDSANMIIFVSWHGGNKPVITRFVETEQSHFTDIKLVQTTFGDAGTDILAEKLLAGPPDDHAGNTEVALSLAIRPTCTTRPKPDDRKDPIEFSWDKRIIEVQPDGEIDSHPKWVATPEIGKELIKVYSDNLITKIRALMTK